ncbi:MAG: hypothetical protein CVU29_09510 [Betaproteobacteria bacterium HGW-Betaproteobacteria-22]|nr:MAG: hypothetical protein CVU29_09510 [Betaproteobacteria bacterium HGW-Betaproteobacteria-22]
MPKFSVRIPFSLIMLDVIGVLLLTLGVLKHFAAVDIIPEHFQFESYGLVFIFAGAVLILPMLLHVVSRIKASQKT